MLLKITSSNHDFSYQINKNPKSPPRFSSCRGGYLMGWYSDFITYNIAFIEGQDNVSFGYGQNEFEFLSQHRYICPLIPMRMIADFFGKVSNGDQPGIYSIAISTIAIKPKTQELLNKYFNGLTIKQLSQYSDRHCSLVLVRESLNELLSTLDLICLICALDLNYYIDVSDDFLIKYFNKIAEIDAPYFFRYLMKTNLIRSSSQFELVRDTLQTSLTHQYNFVPLSNQHARMKLVEPLNGSVLDIGCGEGSYLSRFAKLCDRYVCVDRDERALELSKRKSERKGFDHCEFYNSLDDVQGNFSHVICMEVLEHIDMQDVPDFLQEVNRVKGSRFVFSSPNSLFNQYYQLEDCERHEDHKWEIDSETFFSLVTKHVDGNAKMIKIGDVVNGESPTTGIVITR